MPVMFIQQPQGRVFQHTYSGGTNVDIAATFLSIYGVAATSIGRPLYVDIVNDGTMNTASTSTPALVTGTWPTDSIINFVNNVGAGIYGKGGIGGRGGDPECATFVAEAGVVGSPGGLAVSLGYDMTLVNNGTIGGGGGGGGGGGSAVSFNGGPLNGASGGGGGGGQTSVLASAGSAGSNHGCSPIYLGSSGNSSVNVNPSGNGGDGGNASGAYGGGGAGVTAGVTGSTGESAYVDSSSLVRAGGAGSGGGLGAAGGTGGAGKLSAFAAITTYPGAAGGTAGAAIVQNGYTLTQSGTGNTYGSVS